MNYPELPQRIQPETPLTWYNGRNLAGVPVDGVPDTIDPTYSPWQLVTSQWGSYLRSLALALALTLARAITLAQPVLVS